MFSMYFYIFSMNLIFIHVYMCLDIKTYKVTGIQHIYIQL